MIGLFTFLISGVSNAQDKTLMNSINSDKKISVFGGPIVSAVPMNSTYGVGFGGGGGLVIDNFFIGAFGMGNVLENTTINSSNMLHDIEIGYGGLWLGYSFKDEWLVHPYVSLRSGLGTLELYHSSNDDMNFLYERIAVVSPEVGLEVNIIKQLKLAGTVGYRWMNNFDNNLLIGADYNGLLGSITLRFGGF